MKNKRIKNLIALAIFAVFIFGANFAFAYTGDTSYNYNIRGNFAFKQQLLQQQYDLSQQQVSLQSQLAEQQYYYDQQQIIDQQNILQQKQQLALQKQLNSAQAYNTVTNTQPQIRYLNQPTTTVQYIPQQAVQYIPQQNVQYVNGSTQGASAVRSNTSALTGTSTSGTTTGQYVNFDGTNPNMLGASAYNGYSTGQVAGSQAVRDNSGSDLTALSINGSGSFLPSSVYQWVMFFLLALAIVIVIRIIIRKTAANNSHHEVPVH
jgi:hypothetical protein